jgi:hypothetical protein
MANTLLTLSRKLTRSISTMLTPRSVKRSKKRSVLKKRYDKLVMRSAGSRKK